MSSMKYDNDITLKLSKKLETLAKTKDEKVNLITDDFPDKSKLVAFVLALGLGGFGMHKFYLGEKNKGKLYFIFCWTFVPAMLALIETIKIYRMTEEEFQSVYSGTEERIFIEEGASISKTDNKGIKSAIHFFSEKVRTRVEHVSI